MILKIKCKQAKGVRWLSHDNATKIIACSLPSILISLDRKASENGEPTAHGLYKLLQVCGHFVLSFRERMLLIQPCLNTTFYAINKYKDTAGSNLAKIDQAHSTDLKDFAIAATIALKRRHLGLAFKLNT